MARVTRVACATPEHTIAAGKQLAAGLRDRLAAGRGAVIALQGDLGAGKTTFAKGIALGLGIGEAVTSPTYQLVLEYETARPRRDMEDDERRCAGIGRRPASSDQAPVAAADGAAPLTLYHVDLYRVDSAAQLESLALDDFIHGTGVALVEWPEHAGDTLPDDAIHVAITIADDLSREVRITDPGGMAK